MRGFYLILMSFLFIFSTYTFSHALPINLKPGPMYFQFNNLEQVDTSLNNNIQVPGTNPLTGNQDFGTAGNWGLVNLSSIQIGAVATPHEDINGGTVYFYDDGPGGTMGQITGIFYGINLLTGTTATGGILDLYWRDPGADPIRSADLSGDLPPNDSTVDYFLSGGTFLARLRFAPGIIPGNSSVTISSDMDVTNITGSGRADSFADVDTSVVGAWTKILDNDWFYVDVDGDGIKGESGERRDVRLSNFFNLLDKWDDPNNPKIIGIRSNDPGRTYVVPEPATMFLFGSGLLGLSGLAARRKKKQS